MDKNEQRRAMLARLALVEPGARRAAGEAVARAVLALPEVAGVEGLMLFLSMRDELDTDPLVELALESGRAVYAPRTLKKGRRIVPVRVRSLEAVVRGAYDIREPAGDETLEPAALDAVVVPAVAFDRDGWRLGRGGGFYDRLLDALPARALRCGIGYRLQLVDEVVREPHDRPVDLVVTEHEVHRPARR